jgi:hypothetical protein
MTGGGKMSEDLWSEILVPSDLLLESEEAEAEAPSALLREQFLEGEREMKIPHLPHDLTVVVRKAEAQFDEEEQILKTLAALLSNPPESERRACPPSVEEIVALVTVTIVAEIGAFESETGSGWVTEIGRRETTEMQRPREI